MRYTPFYTLGLFLTVAPTTLGFEDSNNHYLRSLGHKHRNKRGSGGGTGIDVDINASTGSGGSKDRPTWKLTDDFRGKGFYEHFTFEAISDPTHGRVKLVFIFLPLIGSPILPRLAMSTCKRQKQKISPR